MKSALNPFPMCHFLLDNMMDVPFYSLFHLLCCSKLYFQGAFTWNIHFWVTWLFIREEAQRHQGFQEGGEKRHEPNHTPNLSSLTLCHSDLIPAKKKKKTLKICAHCSIQYVLIPAKVTLHPPFLTLLMAHRGGIMRLTNTIQHLSIVKKKKKKKRKWKKAREEKWSEPCLYLSWFNHRRRDGLSVCS